MAGIVGPVVVNYIREFQLARGLPADQAYNVTMYVLAAMLLGGLACNALVRPVSERHFMSPDQLAAERALAHEQASGGSTAQAPSIARRPGLLFAAWLAIALPLAWGVWITVTKSLALFR